MNKNVYNFLGIAALVFLFLGNINAQPFRTPTLTGNAFADFTAAEKSATFGDLTYEMTWDATNLYLGVSAVFPYAKNEPTIYYIDTDPNGGTGSTTGYNNYDGRTGTLPFKANVVIYLKNGYSEMRTNTNGTWSSQTVLTPNITTGANDIEIFIPWSNIPGGRPLSMNHLIFKENGSGGTDAYNIHPGGGYISNINTTAFTGFVSIANTNSTCVANTMTSSPAGVALSNIPTQPSGFANGAIAVSGLGANTSYSVVYTKDGVPSTPSTLVSNGAGQVSIASLGAGIYTGISFTPLTGCGAFLPFNVTLTSNCTTNAGTFPSN